MYNGRKLKAEKRLIVEQAKLRNTNVSWHERAKACARGPAAVLLYGLRLVQPSKVLTVDMLVWQCRKLRLVFRLHAHDVDAVASSRKVSSNRI